MSTNGVFITFEGCEGAGKTTVIEQLYKDLEAAEKKVIKTREPGGIHIAEKIRAIILDPEHTEMDSGTEALLYAASRRQHLQEKIVPALRDGYIVLCDRFIDSSLAYQGSARGIGVDDVLAINQFAIGEHMPDATVYLDIEPEKGLERIHKNKDREFNRLDGEALDFHLNVYQAYHMLLEHFPDRIHKIEANRPIDQVMKDVHAFVSRYVNG